MPDRLRAQLIYNDPTQQRASISANFVAWVFRANSVWDPDPLFASGGISGLSELAPFYSFYRVDAVAVEMEGVSLDTIAYTIGVCPTNINPGSLISSRAAALDFLENPRALQSLIPVAGGPVARLKARFDLATIYGDRRQYMSDINFSSAVTTNPVQIVWLGFTMFTGGTIGTSGVTLSTRLMFDVEFFHRNPLFG